MASKAKTAPAVLVVHQDVTQAQVAAMALDAAGLNVEACAMDGQAVAEAWARVGPAFALVHAELADPKLLAFLAELEAAGQRGAPIALMCSDTRDDVFVRQLRTGVVELLKAPFNKGLHVTRLRLLTVELPERSGRLKGRGAKGELLAMVRHCVAARRSGTIEVAPGTAQEGTVVFSRGTLKDASFGGAQGRDAVAALAHSELPWLFTEAEPEADLSLPSEGPDFGNEAPPEPDAAATGAGEGEPGAGSERQAFSQAEGEAGSGTEGELDVGVVGGTGGVGGPQAGGHAPARGGAAAPAAGTAAPPPDPDAGRWPLLLVDDEPSVVQMLSSYFGKRGYPVHTAPDGVQALQVLTSHRIEAVIADLAMPRLDGWGLLRAAREDLRTREVPIAVYSAHDNFREALQVLNSGAQAYFSKSLRLSALEVQVRELLEPRRRFLRLVQAEGAALLDLGKVGPQWVLRVLAARRYSGQLGAKDRYTSWRLHLEGGRLVAVSSRVGQIGQKGAQALGTFLCSDDAQGTLSSGQGQAAEEFGGQPTEPVLAAVVARLNDEQRRASDEKLARARKLEVDPALYALYLSVGAPAWVPIARQLCELNATPAEVCQRLGVAPQEVAAVVKDLIRRGAVTPQG